MTTRTILVTLLLLLVAAPLLTGCAPGPNELAGVPDAAGRVAGFWLGLWHGFIVLFSFIASLIWDGVEVYEVHNNGGWYDFGYVLGVMLFFGGGGGGAHRRSRSKNRPA